MSRFFFLASSSDCPWSPPPPPPRPPPPPPGPPPPPPPPYWAWAAKGVATRKAQEAMMMERRMTGVRGFRKRRAGRASCRLSTA
ncbi:MAG: hypothetical protein E8A12_02815 [Phenylobacterium sp.]|nr:MAG: hypothetical protein E8A12_02815 [Phenylobacterium sp.]